MRNTINNDSITITAVNTQRATTRNDIHEDDALELSVVTTFV